jgi:hypothetical protein
MPEGSSNYLKPPQAAAYLQVSTSALAKKRVYGNGPNFVRWGRAIRYRRDDLDAFMAARLVRSTSERPSTAAQASADRSRPKGDVP